MLTANDGADLQNACLHIMRGDAWTVGMFLNLKGFITVKDTFLRAPSLMIQLQTYRMGKLKTIKHL